MSRPELADVIREHRLAYVGSHATSSRQRRVLSDLIACRTSLLGGHLLRCDRCSHEEISYNSCRNRHCPKCQAMARAVWLDERRQDLLPVPYFHVVFTLPSELDTLALQNQRKLYGLLFQTASQTLKEIAGDGKHLGADIGFLAVLHTWGQTLRFHPHVHCVVPGGGIDSGPNPTWVPCRDRFFLPVRVLSRLFRGKYIAGLKALLQKGELEFHGNGPDLDSEENREQFISVLFSKEWVVYAKPPFGGPEQVLKYLARYTHRVAISNQRLLSIDGGVVSFTWKNYARGGIKSTMKLPAMEFLRRFLLHVLPKGFVRIRQYGFLSNRSRNEKLELARRLLGAEGQVCEPEEVTGDDNEASFSASEREDSSALGPNKTACPACKKGFLHIVCALSREYMITVCAPSHVPP